MDSNCLHRASVFSELGALSIPGVGRFFHRDYVSLWIRVSSPVEEFIGAIEGVVDGVIIAVAFLSPLSAQFGEARP